MQPDSEDTQHKTFVKSVLNTSNNRQARPVRQPSGCQFGPECRHGTESSGRYRLIPCFALKHTLGGHGTEARARHHQIGNQQDNRRNIQIRPYP